MPCPERSPQTSLLAGDGSAHTSLGAETFEQTNPGEAEGKRLGTFNHLRCSIINLISLRKPARAGHGGSACCHELEHPMGRSCIPASPPTWRQPFPPTPHPHVCPCTKASSEPRLLSPGCHSPRCSLQGNELRSQASGGQRVIGFCAAFSLNLLKLYLFLTELGFSS